MIMMEMFSLLLMISKNIKLVLQNCLCILLINYLMSMNNIWMENTNLYMYFYQDKYCSFLVLLNLWISMILIMITKNKNFLIISLMILINMTFMSISMIFFYIWFEISLIPLFIMIFLLGKSKERTLSSMYMLMYTMLGSLPLFMTIFLFYKINNSIEWNFLILFNMENINFIIYFNMIIAFLIKIPVFGFHIWLPKAHVEAPVYGSMILASIVLKMGMMGLMRMMMISLDSVKKFNMMIMNILILGTLMISILCLMQSDMKSIVAYSSVVHMGIGTISIMTLYKWGYSGGMVMMIGHGLCSSAMFYLVNVFYSRSSTRIIFLNKGNININPSMVFLWFIACIGNMGAPISLNFFSELMMTNTIISWSKFMVLFLILINLFGSLFSMNLFMMTIHGNIFKKINSPIKMIEYYTLILHLVPLNLLSFYSWIWNINF
uniref:NADH-ubiquinone oxidoreductase chain 4 n=1 Tax=Auplopus sp. SJW-2017 TaxID=1940101 RepID=A0A1P8VH99_9HYME|nr:NADH dehydrogenase subunit 4 [Auplopus sp. SJW-2017]